MDQYQTASGGIANLSGLNYPMAMSAMRGITIKLPESTLRQLRHRARQSGRSVSALVRELVEAQPHSGGSVFAPTSDLAGRVSGGSLPPGPTRSGSPLHAGV